MALSDNKEGGLAFKSPFKGEIRLHMAILMAALWSAGLTIVLLGCAFVVSYFAKWLFPNSVWEADILEQGGVFMAIVLYVVDFFVSLYLILKKVGPLFSQPGAT
jgi:hypothetical protein